MKFRLHSRHKYKDVCPVCRGGFSDFGGIEGLDGLVFCEKCGILKIRNDVLADFPVWKLGLLKPAPVFACKVCGKECKSALGLFSHGKSHKGNDAREV